MDIKYQVSGVLSMVVRDYKLGTNWVQAGFLQLPVCQQALVIDMNDQGKRIQTKPTLQNYLLDAAGNSNLHFFALTLVIHKGKADNHLHVLALGGGQGRS
jgi:hypothetical protein